MSTMMEKASRYGKRKFKKGQEPSRFNFDIGLMTMFCSYIISENISIHRNSLISMRELFGRIDESMFENNQACISRFRFCKAALSSRLDKNIHRRDLILRDVYGICGNNFEDLDKNLFSEISNDDVAYIEGVISDCSNISYINNSILDLHDICNQYINADFNSKGAMADVVKNKINEIQNQLRKYSVDADDINNTVDFNNFENPLMNIYQDMERPGYKLKTGMKAFNDILAGGFEGGRVYSLFGLPGEGKTTTLMNLAYQIKKYNKDYELKDKTKIPCIVVLTMENQHKESLKMMFNIACTPAPMEQFSYEESRSLLNRCIGVTEDDPINIFIRYKPINSVDTSYLYKLTDDLEDQGYEVICLIHDYMKRIRPVDRQNDMRIDLGTVVNEFRNFAVYKNIPVITASQFNREGVRTVDMARGKESHNLVGMLGRSMIGESGLIDENLDASIFIAREVLDGRTYMGFALTKHRYPIDTEITRFYQPFQDGSRVKYMTDEGLSKGLFRLNMCRNENEMNTAFQNSIKTNGVPNLDDLDDDLDMAKKAAGSRKIGAMIQQAGYPTYVTPPQPTKSIQCYYRLKKTKVDNGGFYSPYNHIFRGIH